MADDRKIQGSIRTTGKGRKVLTDPDEAAEALTPEQTASLQERGVLTGKGWKGGRKSASKKGDDGNGDGQKGGGGDQTGGGTFPTTEAELSKLTKDELEAEYTRRREAGEADEVKGTGSDGNVVKADLVAALATK